MVEGTQPYKGNLKYSSVSGVLKARTLNLFCCCRRAAQKESEGSMRPAGRTLPIPGLASHKAHNFFTLLLGNRHFHSKHFVSHLLEVVFMLAPEYKVDVTFRNGVIADFTWIHYVPVWLRSLTYFHKIGSCDQDHILKICAYFEVYRPLRFWYIRS